MTPEFVIIGGGAYGCAVAYHLAGSGASVVVLEAGSIADGASGGPGKRGVRANRRDTRELPLMRESYDMWPDLEDELGALTGYERTGGISLIEREVVGLSGGLVAADAHRRVQSSRGIPTELWDRERVRAAFPGIADGTRAGLYAPLDGVASQEATSHAYAQAARARGADIREGAKVVAVERRAGSGIGVSTSRGEEFTATRNVLIAANAATSSIVEDSFGTHLPMWTVYPQALFLKASNPLSIPLLTGHDNRALSIKILDTDTVMLSGGWRGRYNSETKRGELDPEAVQGNIEQLTSVFPHLGELTMVEADASRPEAVSPDQIPFIGEVAEDVFVATGWSGHGWALLPAASMHIARMLRENSMPPRLLPFAPNRIPMQGGRNA